MQEDYKLGLPWAMQHYPVMERIIKVCKVKEEVSANVNLVINKLRREP